MGALSDIIIADQREAVAISAARGAQLNQWPRLESKGIDPIKLFTLSQILHGRSVDDVDACAGFMNDAVLGQSSDEGPWVYLIPPGLQAAIASLDDQARESVAEKWAATEEFVLDRWHAADVEEYLNDLIAHARKATEAGKSLLLWMSP